MKNQFVTYEIALALKELGFNEACLGAYYPEPDSELIPCKWYNNNNHRLNPKIAAPLWQQAIDYLREKHNLHVEIRYLDSVAKYGYILTKILENDEIEEEYYFDYYEAREVATFKAIEICKQKK